MALSHHVRRIAIAARLASLRESCGSAGVCSLGEEIAADRGGVAARPIRNRGRDGFETASAFGSREFWFSPLEPRRCERILARAERFCRARYAGQRMGMDFDSFRPVSGV